MCPAPVLKKVTKKFLGSSLGIYDLVIEMMLGLGKKNVESLAPQTTPQLPQDSSPFYFVSVLVFLLNFVSFSGKRGYVRGQGERCDQNA